MIAEGCAGPHHKAAVKDLVWLIIAHLSFIKTECCTPGLFRIVLSLRFLSSWVNFCVKRLDTWNKTDHWCFPTQLLLAATIEEQLTREILDLY